MPRSTQVIIGIFAVLVLLFISLSHPALIAAIVLALPLVAGASLGPRIFSVEKKWAVINGLLIGLLVDAVFGLIAIFVIVSTLR
jgi:hypothetical protein